MTKRYAELYTEIIEKFLTKSITALDFERRFLTLWHENAEYLEGGAYSHIENLFYSVDEFTDLPLEPADNPDHYISEDQLRESAAKALQELRALNGV